MITRLALLLLLATAALHARASSVIGVYEGRTPCGAIAADFTGFPSQGCEKIKWRLTLRSDRTYLYQGTRSQRAGTWTLDGTTYRLRYDDKVLALRRIDDNILLILDRGLKPLVGDASWNYTLCRTSARN